MRSESEWRKVIMRRRTAGLDIDVAANYVTVAIQNRRQSFSRGRKPQTPNFTRVCLPPYPFSS